MKPVVIASFLAFIFFTACKNSDKDKKGVGGNDKQSSQAIADTLYQQVIDIHNIGMAGWMKIDDKQKILTRLLDSVSVLPAKMKAAAEPYKLKLEEALDALTSAYKDMDDWMPTLNLDSAKNDLEKRISYFTKEKLNAETVNQAIFNSLRKADSILNAKY